MARLHYGGKRRIRLFRNGIAIDARKKHVFRHAFSDRLQVFNPTFLIIGKLEKVSDGNCGLSASFGNIAA